MSEFLNSLEWDAPFFKRLPKNDTGQSSSHQGGMVIPKELRKYFPVLDEGMTSAQHPTTDRDITTEMYQGIEQIADGNVRYQFQTWGGTRAAESRITDGFGPLHQLAAEGDILIFQRSSDAVERFRLILVRKSTRAFREIDTLAGGRRWGSLFETNVPMTQSDLQEASNDLNNLADQPFTLIKLVVRVESRHLRIARSSAFPLLVGKEYQWRCCVSGIKIETPVRIFEVEAAHVVPVNEGGTDDVRNGLALARSLHWAFDRGLFGIKPDRTIHIPRQVMSSAENAFLKQFRGKSISETRSRKFRVHADALAWHFKNRVSNWQ
jgi:putative restriction endonuclease